MQSTATTIEHYLTELPEDRKSAMKKLHEVILKNIPKGFVAEMSYGMISYNIPHSLYPAGYHCKPEQALPFAGIASQKNFIAFYHMGVYAIPELLDWYKGELAKFSSKKADMGKSCTRFKKPEDIPFDVIGELMQKISVQDWIECYEKNYKKK